MVHRDLSFDPVPIEFLKRSKDVELWIKRDDLIDEEVSGNKLYKLRNNIKSFLEDDYDAIVTFGGAFSNHIAATASLCNKLNIPCVGIVRGEKTDPLNATLARAKHQGMKLQFVSRELYRKKDDPHFIGQLDLGLSNPLVIPEGGANLQGIQGASEILDGVPIFDFIVCAVGTGTTAIGLPLSLKEGQMVLAIPIHKHEKVIEETLEHFADLEKVSHRITVQSCHFGGYAKHTPELIEFIRAFKQEFGIMLDPIYTGKAMYKTHELIESGYFPKGSRILFVHTGGIQGIEGFESRFGALITDS